MNYKTTSDFSYKIAGQANKIDEKIFFNSVSPDQFDIVKQYYKLIKEGKIEEAIKYINESKVHTFNASLFNCIVNRLKTLENYYYEKYWNDNHWATDEEQKFEMRNDRTFLFLNSPLMEDGDTVEEATLLEELMDENHWESGELDQSETLNCDYVQFNPTTIYPAHNSSVSCVYTNIPIRIKRGNYNIDVFVDPNKMSEYKAVFGNKNHIDLLVFCGIWGFEDLAKAPENTLTEDNNGCANNVPIADVLDHYSIDINKNFVLNISNLHDSKYSSSKDIDDYFTLVFEIYTTDTNVDYNKFLTLIKNKIIQFIISPITN